jgi:hypothetical protein
MYDFIVELLLGLSEKDTVDTFFSFPATPESVPKIANMAIEMWKEMNTPFGER